MHEMSLVRPVVETVLEACEGQPVRRVASVHLTIGEAHDVIDEYVPGLFRHLARGTVAADAEVIIQKVPLRVRCGQCGEVFGADLYSRQAWVCPECGCDHGHGLASGREFTIDNIVVEVDAQAEKGREPAWVAEALAARKRTKRKEPVE